MACMTSINSKLQRNWGWVVTFASFIMNFFGFGIMYCFSITFVSLQDEFNTGSTATSWAGSIPIGLATSSGLFVTPLVARFENRPVAIAGVFMCCASCILTSFIADFRLIYLSYSILYGLGNGFSSLASMDLLLRYFPKKNCSRSTLISLIGSSSGMLALGPLTYIVIENWGWRNMFRFFGGLLLLVSLPAVITFSRPNAREGACAEEKDGEKKVAAISTSKRRPTLLEVDERPPEKEGVEHMGYVDEEQKQQERIYPAFRTQLDSYSSPDVPNGKLVENPYTYDDLNAGDLVIQVESEKQLPIDTDAVEATNVMSMMSPDTNDIASLKVITISSSNSCQVHSIIDHAGSMVNGEVVMSPTATQKQLEAEGVGEEEEEPVGFFQKYRALFYPDLWLICICITGLPMMNTFYYINMGDFLISRGFERHVIPWTVTTFGVSEVIGKILLAVIADRLPFPKIFIYHFACVVGIAVMGCLLVVTTVPAILVLAAATGMITMMVADALAYSICNQVFRPVDLVQTWTVVMVTQGFGYMLGSLFGESIDRTGSYNSAIYSSMGVYALCGLVCLAVPFYQKYVTPKRFVMFEYQDICRRKKSIQKRHQPEELVNAPK